jgi:hypothetical protein
MFKRPLRNRQRPFFDLIYPVPKIRSEKTALLHRPYFIRFQTDDALEAVAGGR